MNESPKPMQCPVKGRFAPSPTGRMHAGNIYASLLSWLIAKSQDGQIVLRIEDIDTDRSRTCYSEQLLRDYEMLGLGWDEGPYYQSQRINLYQEAYDSFVKRNLIYPCYCSRADILASSAPHRGEKPVYAGTCRNLSPEEQKQKALTKDPAWRLIVPDRTYSFTDSVQGQYKQNLLHECGDFLVRRSDCAFAYQLAVVIDDALMGVNSVTRGVDLLCSTPQQIYLQELLGFPQPRYAHVPLLVAEKDRRLSKRDRDASMDELLALHGSSEGIIGHIAYTVGLIDIDEPASPEQILKTFNLQEWVKQLRDPIQIYWS